MKKILYALSVTGIFCFAFLPDIAHATQNSVYIKGTIEAATARDTAILKLTGDVFTRYSGIKDRQVKVPIINGEFVVRLDSIETPRYVEFNILKKKPLFPTYYLIEPGDSMVIDLRNDALNVNGQGAEKFRLTYILKNIPLRNNLSNEQLNKQDLDFFKALHNRNQVRQQAIDSVLLIYKDSVTDIAFQTIGADVFAEHHYNYYKALDFYMNRALDSNDTMRIQMFKRLYNELLAAYENDRYAQFSNILHSRYFIDFILMKVQVELKMKYMKAGTKRTELFDFADIYQAITDRYSGLILDRVLTKAFINYYNSKNDTAGYLDSALIVLSRDFYKKIVSSLSSFGIGKMAFDFKLKDSTGKFHKLGDYKGKVVVLEFWMVGCHFCANLGKGMKNVATYFQNKPVQFITICSENDIEKWNQALKSGVYTTSQSVNLITGESVFNGHLTGKYNVSGFPSLLIIDADGVIRNIEPERPLREQSTKTFISYIESLIRS